jgi:hypothetical protein
MKKQSGGGFGLHLPEAYHTLLKSAKTALLMNGRQNVL